MATQDLLEIFGDTSLLSMASVRKDQSTSGSNDIPPSCNPRQGISKLSKDFVRTRKIEKQWSEQRQGLSFPRAFLNTGFNGNFLSQNFAENLGFKVPGRKQRRTGLSSVVRTKT